MYLARSQNRVKVHCVCGHVVFTWYQQAPAERIAEADEDTATLLETLNDLHAVEAELLAEMSGPAQLLYLTLRRVAVEKGPVPSYQELADRLGWASGSTVAYHLRQLSSIGLVERERNKVRSMSLPYVA